VLRRFPWVGLLGESPTATRASRRLGGFARAVGVGGWGANPPQPPSPKQSDATPQHRNTARTLNLFSETGLEQVPFSETGLGLHCKAMQKGVGAVHCEAMQPQAPARPTERRWVALESNALPVQRNALGVALLCNARPLPVRRNAEPVRRNAEPL
jgi:hypothetical protein